MAREVIFSVNLARRLEKLPTPGLDTFLGALNFCALKNEFFNTKLNEKMFKYYDVIIILHSVRRTFKHFFGYFCFNR